MKEGAALHRRAEVARTTRETAVRLSLDLDGAGTTGIQTGVGFFDHVLDALARHALFDLQVEARGDLAVDPHHTVEDVGIALGRALRQALGPGAGISRFGHAYVPMDEALARAVVDLSGRPFPRVAIPVRGPAVGAFPTELAAEFLRAVAVEGRFALHVDVLAGENDHHVIEAVFKAVGRALRAAVALDPREQGVPSTKGVLDL